METMSLSALVLIGVFLSVAVPSPICPYAFLPQAQTVPSDFRARLCCPFAAIAVIPPRPYTRTGMFLLFVVPSPSCPAQLPPHAQTVPSDFKAILCGTTWRRHNKEQEH